MNQNLRKTGVLNFEYRCALALASLGIFVFVKSRTDLWSWPSLDMATFYAALDHPSLKSSDFFTSCFDQDNGRQAFGLITAWPIHLGLSWYQTIYLWMIVGSALLPVSLFLGIQSVIPTRSRRTATVLFLFLLAAILYPAAIRYFVVGWWSSWGNDFHPSRFAISFIFLSVRPISSRGLFRQVIGVTLAMIAVLCHPSFAIGGLILISVLLLSERKYQTVIKLFLTLLGAFVVITAISNSGSLSTNDYLNWFVWLHPEHYIPSRFLSLTMSPTPWFYPALTISSVLVTGGYVLYLLHAKLLARVSIVFLCLYWLSILLQYLFVEKFPIFKPLILLAPVRFTAFGWLMAVVAATLVFVQIANCLSYPSSYQKLTEFSDLKKVSVDVRAVQILRIVGILSIVFVVSRAGSATNELKEPSSHLDSSKGTLLRWIEQNTEITDEIAAPDFLTVEIPLLTFRGTYHGNGFPFNDRCLKENSQRFINLWGTPRSADWPGYVIHYDSLTVTDFQEMSPQVDWVIMKTTSRATLLSVSQRKPSYQNTDYVVFKISNEDEL